MSESAHPRSIRSFVTRAGRITAAQERALAELWPKYGVAPGPGLLERGQLFGRAAPCTLEIGFGNGENLAALARQHPERDYLGVEVHRPGVGRLLLALEQHQLANVRVICHDAVEVLERQIAPGSLGEILVLFPDPWPKKRHQKRRLLSPEVIAQLARLLVPGGEFRFASDNGSYAGETLLTILASGAFAWMAESARDWRVRPSDWPETRYERKALSGNAKPSYLTFHRR